MEQESIIAIEESEDLYGVLYPYVKDEKITDIDYNGKDVWVRDCNNYKRKIDVEITDAWVAQFTQRISNYVSKELNVQFNTHRQILLKTLYAYVAQNRRMFEDNDGDRQIHLHS